MSCKFFEGTTDPGDNYLKPLCMRVGCTEPGPICEKHASAALEQIGFARPDIDRAIASDGEHLLALVAELEAMQRRERDLLKSATIPNVWLPQCHAPGCTRLAKILTRMADRLATYCGEHATMARIIAENADDFSESCRHCGRKARLGAKCDKCVDEHKRERVLVEAKTDASRCTPRPAGDHIDTTWKLEVEQAIANVPEGLDAEGWRAAVLGDIECRADRLVHVPSMAQDSLFLQIMAHMCRSGSHRHYNSAIAAAKRERGVEVVCEQDWEME